MSRLSGSTLPTQTGANRAVLSVSARYQVVLATLGYMPAGVLGALMACHANLLDNHRRSVISNAHKTWPGRTQAGRFVAATTRFFPAKRRNPEAVEELEGQSFAFSDVPKIMGNLQTGGTIRSTKGPMFIPFAGDMESRAEGTRALHRDVPLGIRSLAGFRNSISTSGVVWQDTAIGRGERAIIVPVAIGVVRMQRKQRPLLKFFQKFDEILPKHLKAYDRVFDLALTEAGRAKLESSDEQERIAGLLNLTTDQKRSTRRLSANLRRASLANKNAVFDPTSRLVMTNTQRRMVGQLVSATSGTTKVVTS